MLEVTKFIAEKNSNVHNDSVLKVSENTLSKSYIKYLGILFSVLQKYLGFGLLTVSEMALQTVTLASVLEKSESKQAMRQTDQHPF